MSNILLYKDVNGGEWMDFSVHKIPIFKEDNNYDSVLWGIDDDYKNRQPDYYEWLYNSSAKHRAIINRKVLFIVGKGVDANLVGLTPEQKTKALGYAYKYNDIDFIKKISLNWTKLGGFCYEVIVSKDKKILEAHYVNFAHVRRSKIEYDTDGNQKPIVFEYTRNWKKRDYQDNPDYKTFESFSWDKNDMSKGTRYLVWYSDDDEQLYPLPEYTAAIPYIAADYEISNFVYNNTRKGFAASFLIEFVNGDPTEDQKEQVVNMVKGTLHGSDNAGDPAVGFIEGKENATVIQPIPNNGQDDRYVNLNKQIREEIYSGHTINPIVVGLKGETGFSNNADELRTAIEEFQLYYVTGKQIIIEQHLNALRMLNGVPGELFIKRLDPIQSKLSETTLLQVASQNEIRAMIGLETLDTSVNATADALKSMSPLVANKVLESMTLDEIRALVSLKQGVAVERVVARTVNKFSKDEQDKLLVACFNECGILDDDYEFLTSRELDATDIADAKFQAGKMVSEYSFASKLENAILGIKKDNPDITIPELAKLLNETPSTVQSAVDNITANEITEPEEEIIAVYKYVKRSDVKGADVIESTRDFCRKMVQMSQTKSWTINEIEAMNNGMGLDVFTSRGGFMTLPNRVPAVRVPFCRHVWKVSLVRKKK